MANDNPLQSAEITSFGDLTETVRTLAELMTEHGLTKLDLKLGPVMIRMRSRADSDGPPAATVTSSPISPAVSPTTPLEEGYLVTAPMIGTYYSAPAPGEAPFVQVGDRVEVGQVIGIIEAMKIMNEISADRSGIVKELLVSNAQAVEYGSPLMRLVQG
jgi:acetyl-CoA carboxylase biotin carboxyl carrier protein